MRLTASHALKWIALISVIAGTLDGLAALIIYQADPIKLFQMIASAAIGAKAFNGGLTTFFLGLFFHYLIATSWTILFFTLYGRVVWLQKKKWLVIIAYGLFVWIVMNLVVVPSSILNRAMPTFSQFALGAAILIVAISLPIVLLTERAYRVAHKADPVA